MSAQPDGLLAREARLPLRINQLTAVDFIRRAFDLGDDLNGPGRCEIDDPVQGELRKIRGWIEMAERDALDARRTEPLSRTQDRGKGAA